MNVPNRFLEKIKEKNFFDVSDQLLLAVSGGIDSIVLCELCNQAGFDFVIAHCNFQLRGSESERDETFVVSLGKKYNKKVFTKRFDTKGYASENKVSTQVAARELRYSWFYELLSVAPNSELRAPNYLLTAHHANDNVETVLMNFFKGTGIAGLRGIEGKQGKIIRPLLDFKKEELIVFANENNLQWMEDSSNITDAYSRNYFRNQVIPLVQKIYPKAEDNLLQNIKRFADIEQLYQQAIHQHKRKLLEARGNEVHIPVLKLQQAKPLESILYEICKEYDFTPNQVEEITRLLDSETGKFVQSSSYRIFRNRKWLIIAPVASGLSDTILIEEGTQDIHCASFRIAFSRYELSNYKPQMASSIAQLDLQQIRFPLILRKWKAGDYIYPLGMKKKKKVSRFFIDNKFSKTEKENCWILESDKRILWIVGHRIDERFKITSNSKNILQITCQHE